MTGSRRIPVYLEAGTKRVFAGALEWPGWSRSGRDESAAIGALLSYGKRYRRAVGRVGDALVLPESVADLDVRERLRGNATTDFGAPGVPPAADNRPLDESEAERWSAILRACWTSFDRMAAAALGKQLATGPRGGGRELEAIVRHIVEAEQAYVAALGGRYRSSGDSDIGAVTAGTRASALETLTARVRGDPLPPSRRIRPSWPPRYFIRRTAWHALDHAWEIEDRAGS